MELPASKPTLMGPEERNLLDIVMSNLRVLFKEHKGVMNFTDPKQDLEKFLESLKQSSMLSELVLLDKAKHELQEVSEDLEVPS